MTPKLRFEVTQFLVRETVGSIPLFNRLGSAFQAEVYPRLKPLSAGPKEVILTKGEVPERFYFLIKGEIDVLSPIPGDTAVIHRIQPGQYFGEALVLGRRRVATCIASVFCQMWTIGRDDLLGVFEQHPKEARILFEEVMSFVRRKDRSNSLRIRAVLAFMPKLSQSRAALMIQLVWSLYVQWHEALNNAFAKVLATDSTWAVHERRQSTSTLISKPKSGSSAAITPPPVALPQPAASASGHKLGAPSVPQPRDPLADDHHARALFDVVHAIDERLQRVEALLLKQG